MDIGGMRRLKNLRLAAWHIDCITLMSEGVCQNFNTS